MDPEFTAPIPNGTPGPRAGEGSRPASDARPSPAPAARTPGRPFAIVEISPRSIPAPPDGYVDLFEDDPDASRPFPPATAPSPARAFTARAAIASTAPPADRLRWPRPARPWLVAEVLLAAGFLSLGGALAAFGPRLSAPGAPPSAARPDGHAAACLSGTAARPAPRRRTARTSRAAVAPRAAAPAPARSGPARAGAVSSDPAGGASREDVGAPLAPAPAALDRPEPAAPPPSAPGDPRAVVAAAPEAPRIDTVPADATPGAAAAIAPADAAAPASAEAAPDAVAADAPVRRPQLVTPPR